MDADGFYCSPREDRLWQGDLLEGVPHLLLRQQDRLNPLKPATLSRGRSGYQEEALPEGSLPPAGQPIQVAASCVIARGVLLTYDCDIDNDPKHRMLALVRPLGGLPEESKQIIRENRNFSFFYLPAWGDVLPESYVDFRRLSTVAPSWVSGASRLASLTEEARKALALAFIRFITRREVGPEGQGV